MYVLGVEVVEWEGKSFYASNGKYHLIALNFKETQIVTKEYLRWAATGAPNAQRTRTPEEVEYSKSLGDFPG